MTKQQKRERQEAIEKLRAMLKPGDTVRTILRHVSRSGMRRCVSPIIDGEDRSYLVALALGAKVDQKHGGIKVDGCGMDMGFHLVYGLSATLWPEGFGCVGDGGENRSARCPSNDHSNGDRDYTPHGDRVRCKESVCFCHDPTSKISLPNGCSSCGCIQAHMHKDGGYALRQRWL